MNITQKVFGKCYWHVGSVVDNTFHTMYIVHPEKLLSLLFQTILPLSSRDFHSPPWTQCKATTAIVQNSFDCQSDTVRFDYCRSSKTGLLILHKHYLLLFPSRPQYLHWHGLLTFDMDLFNGMVITVENSLECVMGRPDSPWITLSYQVRCFFQQNSCP